MHDAGCLPDPATNAYCYVEAAVNSNPSDLYFYQLPLGVSLPVSTMSTCSGCTKSLLAMYAAALGNGAELANLGGLKATYGHAAKLANAECGQGYAASSASSSNAIPHSRPVPWTGAVLVAALWWLLVP